MTALTLAAPASHVPPSLRLRSSRPAGCARPLVPVAASGSVGIDRSRIGEVLELVGLAGREDDSFRSYSLGMRERLAHALSLWGVILVVLVALSRWRFQRKDVT